MIPTDRPTDQPTDRPCHFVTLPQMTGAPVDLYPKTRGLWVSRHAEFDFDGPSTRRRRSMRRSEKTPHFGPRKRPGVCVCAAASAPTGAAKIDGQGRCSALAHRFLPRRSGRSQPRRHTPRASFGVQNEAFSQNDAWNGVVGCWDRRNRTQRVEKPIILVSWGTGLPGHRSSGVA